MRTEIEKVFFKAFEQFGVVDHCIDWMREKYDLGFLPKEGRQLPEQWERYYNETLPNEIREATEAFDDTVVNSLMDEIGSNLDECQSDAQRERYLFSLLKPFKGLSDVYHPTAQINRLRASIEDCKRDKTMWESLPKDKPLFNVAGEHGETPKEQIEACDGSITDDQKKIDRLHYINHRFCEIIGGQINEKNSVEWCLSAFVCVWGAFANRLDALLLERTEFKPEHRSLIWLQRECGIYLKPYREITDVDYYLGSIELARKYISEVRGVEFPDTQQVSAPQTSDDREISMSLDLPSSILSLQPNECQYLYGELTRNGHFMPTGTNQAHFNYVFGGGVCPADFTPLCWNVSKQALSELIIFAAGGKSVPRSINNSIGRVFVDTKKTPIKKLSNPKKDEVSRDWGALQTITNTIKTRSS